MPKPVRVAILISGRGSNMEALMRAAKAQNSLAQIVCVISNRPKAEGLRIAAAAGVPAIAIDHKAYDTREAFEREMDAALREHQAELVCAAGFMRILSPWFVKQWEGRQINIHPSLLPHYKGLNTHARAIENGDAYAGCSVHYVSDELDGGAIIDQLRVPIAPGETAESLSAKVRVCEHRLYPRVLLKVCSDLAARRP